jgi:FHS family L-fucose permease-like MFS transporter
MAIVGGALIPLLMGYSADRIGVQPSFWVPAVCYLYIVFYGLKGSEIIQVTDSRSPLASGPRKEGYEG